MKLGTALAATLLLAGTTTMALAIAEPKIVNTVMTGKARPVQDTRPADDMPAPAAGDGIAQTAPHQGAPLTVQEITSRVESQGFTNVTKVELEHGRYEVYARDGQGHRMELYVDARTGEILKSERD